MVGLIVVVVIVGLFMGVPFYGADSRDGKDWRPLCLASTLPDTDHPPSQPAKWPHAIKHLGVLLKKVLQRVNPRTM